MRAAILTNEDHKRWDRWLANLLELHGSGHLPTDDAIGALGQVLGALDIGNLGEFRAWVEGRNPLASENVDVPAARDSPVA